MKTFSYTITDPLGIHGRPAGEMVKLVKGFSSKTTIEKEGKAPVDASALFKLMGLGIKGGDTIKVSVSGADEEAAAAKVEEFLKANF